MLQQRHGRVFGKLQHPLVEVKPGELAVEVEGRIVDPPIVFTHPPPFPTFFKPVNAL